MPEIPSNASNKRKYVFTKKFKKKYLILFDISLDLLPNRNSFAFNFDFYRGSEIYFQIFEQFFP